MDPQDRRSSNGELRDSLIHSQGSQRGKFPDHFLLLDQQRRQTIEGKIQDEIFSHLPRVNDAEKRARSGQRLFPVFNDFGLSIFSINYALYLEFFYIMIRILFQLLLLVGFLNFLDYYTKHDVFDLVFYSEDEIKEICKNAISDTDKSACAIDWKLLGKCQRHVVRVFYSLFTCFVALFYQTYVRKKEETRIINNPMLYDFNWTQDLFSVLIENIPQSATESELRTFFNNLEPLKKIHGEVKEIVFVQDVTKCVDILQKIQTLEENNKAASQQITQEQVIQTLKNELYREEAKLPLHNGKAIVVFDSLRTRSVVLKLFRRSKTNFLEAFFRGYDTETAFKNSYLYSKKLPEPQNLNFENLYYPKSKKYCRMVSAFVTGIILLTLITVIALVLQVIPVLMKLFQKQNNYWFHKFTNTKEDDSDNALVSPIEKLGRYVIPLALMMTETIQDLFFQAVGKLTKRTSKTDAEQSWLNYSIYSSFFLYLVIQGVIMLFDWNDAAELAQATINIFCAKYLFKKFGGLYFAYRKFNKPEYNDCKGILYSVRNFIAFNMFNINMTTKNFQFRFFKESSRVFPLIAMNFAFMANGSNTIKDLKHIIPTTIPITIITLYIGAICDKYRLINQPEQCKLNSARFMIKLFRFLRVDHFAFWFGALVWMSSFNGFIKDFDAVLPGFLPQDEALQVPIIASVLGIKKIVHVTMNFMAGAYIFYLVVWPSSDSLETKYDFYFEQHRSLVPYDVIAPHFIEIYKKPVFYQKTAGENDNDRASMML